METTIYRLIDTANDYQNISQKQSLIEQVDIGSELLHLHIAVQQENQTHKITKN